ncbi:MAG: site-specific tyrosine recombinase XerD [Flavobacteriales bacterium]
MNEPWSRYLKSYKTYLRLEKGLSKNTINAYLSDLLNFTDYLVKQEKSLSPQQVSLNDLTHFLAYINDKGLKPRSQARLISGVRAFYRYLLLEEAIEHDPSELLEMPRLGKKLPDTLSEEEIDGLISTIDMSTPNGERNKVMLEMLYSCGLRVSELVDLKISSLYWNDAFIRIIGKGNKERLVPVSAYALKLIKDYLTRVRSKQKINKGSEDFVFLNNRGKPLTRVMVFTIVKQLAVQRGLKKSISPHTFRHSFATHLIQNGADLRAVQEMMGHESITTTEIYTHLDRKFLFDTVLKYHPRSK